MIMSGKPYGPFSSGACEKNKTECSGQDDLPPFYPQIGFPDPGRSGNVSETVRHISGKEATKKILSVF